MRMRVGGDMLMRAGACLALLACNSAASTGSVNSNTALDADSHAAFPIAHDARHAGVDCNACHGSFDTFQQFSCTGACHTQPDCDAGHPGLTDYRYDSVSCLSCHPSGTLSGSFASHPFPIDATAVHTGIACATCHTTRGNYAEFTCTGSCHAQPVTDTNHQGVADYAYASASCLSCHPTGIADGTGISHTKFPIGAGTLHPFGCSQCHTDRSQPQNAANFKCATCHAAQDPALVTKHTTTTTSPTVHVNAKEVSTTDSRTCLRCHANAKVDWTKDHSRSHPCSAGAPPHKNAGCTDCHSHYRPDPTYAADFATSPPQGCAECHENNQVCH